MHFSKSHRLYVNELQVPDPQSIVYITHSIVKDHHLLFNIYYAVTRFFYCVMSSFFFILL